MKAMIVMLVLALAGCGASMADNVQTASSHVECVGQCAQCLAAHADSLDEPLAAILNPCTSTCADCALDALETVNELIEADGSPPQTE